jgi:surface polysaccharide O-acyltransferase-like enzyme
MTTSLSQKQEPVRDVSLDFIRLVAILLVICIHVSAKGFALMDQRHWWAVNAYESISRVAVPLFLMVTGALLLRREANVSSMLMRLRRVIIPLFVWSVLYLLWFRYNGLHTTGWIAKILQAPVVPHFWYLYTLIGAYLFLPVLTGFFQANELRTHLFVMVCWFIGASLLPTAAAITGKQYIGVNWQFLPLYAGYIVAGAIIYEKIKFVRSPLYWSASAWTFCIAGIALGTWLISLRLGRANEIFYAYESPFVALGAIFAFIALQEFGKRYVSGRGYANHFLPYLSKVNFGVYLIHVLVMFAVDMRGFDYAFINPWLAIPLTTLIIFFISSAAVAVLQRIPYLRSIVPA